MRRGKSEEKGKRKRGEGKKEEVGWMDWEEEEEWRREIEREEMGKGGEEEVMEEMEKKGWLLCKVCL